MAGLISVSSVIAITSALLVYQLGQPRIWMTMSRDGLLWKKFSKIHPKYHENLRAVGYDDTAILQITLIASWFNYINRVADALGVGRESK